MNIQLQFIDIIESSLLKAQALADVLSSIHDEPPNIGSIQMTATLIRENVTAARSEVLAIDNRRIEAQRKAKEVGEE